MNDLTSKLLIEKYSVVLEENEGNTQLPHGFERVTKIKLENLIFIF